MDKAILTFIDCTGKICYSIVLELKMKEPYEEYIFDLMCNPKIETVLHIVDAYKQDFYISTVMLQNFIIKIYEIKFDK